MSLFPEIAPFATHNVPVGDGHTLYVAQFGNPHGIPVVVLHGGPGSGFGEKAPRRFDPLKYHIICFDQRGAGRSTPSGSLVANTTAHLVADVEILRTYFNIESWAVYGTSWGSTLALAYAQTHTDRVRALTLGGIFLGSKDELDWFNLPEGLARFRWIEYQTVLAMLPSGALNHHTLDAAALAIIQGNNPTLAQQVASAYAVFESSACVLAPDLQTIRTEAAAQDNTGHISIELHYFVNQCFLSPGQLLENCTRISHIPTYIVQGALDLVCPPATAHNLHAALPNSILTMVPLGSHTGGDDLEAARVAATTAMAQTLTHQP
jgi:proline iminopeptidase